MSISKRLDAPLLAVRYYVSNLVIMVLISCLVKILADRYPVNQVLLFRFALATMPLFIFTVWTHGLASIKTTRIRDHAVRSLSGICSLSMLYFALASIPLAEATMLSYSSPIFIAILSIPILGEKIGIPRWSAVIIGFVGVIIIAQPGTAVFNLGGFLAIGSAVAAAFVVIWLRFLSDTENPGTISVIYNGCGTLVFIVWTLVVGWVAIQTMLDAIMLVSIGLLAAVQQYIFALSFRYGEASLIAPFEYLILLFAAIAGLLFWNEVPPATSIIGGIVIVFSGLIIIFRGQLKRIRAGV